MSDIFDFSDKLDRYAVMGNPIKHSQSPQIHQLFARQTGQNMQYDAIHVDLGGFVQAVRQFHAHQGRGLNITVPFKQQAFDLADDLSERARIAGAVNTLILQVDGKITGDNTDGIGLVTDLQENLNWPIQGRHVLLLGAGGACRGVLAPIRAQRPASVHIANRSADKARELAQHFTGMVAIQGSGYEHIPRQHFDVIINATSASLSGKLPPVPAYCHDKQTCCYDMMYAAQDTIFVDWAKKQGMQAADGLGMLVGQAAESFYLWRGVRPQSQPVIQHIRAQLQAG